MTAKKTKAAPQTKTPSSKHIAKATIAPGLNAAAVIEEFGKPFGNQDIAALVAELHTKMSAVHDGDMQHCESMLLGQAVALQTIFVTLSRRAVNQEYLNQYETYLRLALRAQNQSRMTLEALAAIKNPPVVFAKQANINQGSGNQQVNNGAPGHATRAEKTVKSPNELLTETAKHGETVDGGTAGEAIPANPHMETVGAINRG